MPGTLRTGDDGSVSNENELYILKSRSMIRSVINRLDLHTSYIVEGRIKSVDLITRVGDCGYAKRSGPIERDHPLRDADGERVERSHIGTIAGKSVDTTLLSYQLS